MFSIFSFLNRCQKHLLTSYSLFMHSHQFLIFKNLMRLDFVFIEKISDQTLISHAITYNIKTIANN